MPINPQKTTTCLRLICRSTNHFQAVVFVLISIAALLPYSAANAQNIDPFTGAPIKQTSGTGQVYFDDSTHSGSISQSYRFGEEEPDFYTIAQPGNAGSNSGGHSNGGAGWWVRFGHEANKTIGRDESITHIELFPYVFNSFNGVLFGDLRFFRTNQGEFGGNGGVRLPAIYQTT